MQLPRSVAPREVPEGAPLDHPSLFFNRELSWLDFNWRVLLQVSDRSLPLLERVRFLSIACSNLDEFYQKRVGGLLRQRVAGLVRPSVDGRPPEEQLALIRDAGRAMQASISGLWEQSLREELRERAGIVITSYDELAKSQQEALDRTFTEIIYPILTPLAVDPGHPFPFISNLSLSLGVSMRHPERGSIHFARVKIPAERGRWLRVPDGDHRFHFVPVEEVVRANIDSLFPGMELVSVHAFRVTRNADVRRDDEDAEDLLALISDELRVRRFAPVVRLEVEAGISPEVCEILLAELEIGPEDVYEVDGLLGLVDCRALADIDLPELSFEPWDPVIPRELGTQDDGETSGSIFALLRERDLLVHHPYDSFSATVQRLVEEAADDPQVIAIKQTLYRTSDGSPIVRALIRAAERGKQVAVLVEVTARFEEARNIEWAQALEEAGVHVTYGVVGLKTHAKVLLVVRLEEGVPATYCHIGTGNYHSSTARLYTDLGYLTGRRDLGFDLINLFHMLTGYAPDQRYRELLVAPGELRSRFVSLIRREVEHRRAGREARIVWKMNAIDDPEVIRELYAASQAGVPIDLVIRGHTRLRPGLKGYSETIRLISIIGRFLEHDRIYWFANDGDPELFIGSADCRERNFDRRVEALVPIRDPEMRERIWRILELALADNVLAWEMSSDGSYVRKCECGDAPRVDLHAELMRDAVARQLVPYSDTQL
jgi:polyphosphate kinase